LDKALDDGQALRRQVIEQRHDAALGCLAGKVLSARLTSVQFCAILNA
jgi:hypothetical protein